MGRSSNIINDNSVDDMLDDEWNENSFSFPPFSDYNEADKITASFNESIVVRDIPPELSAVDSAQISELGWSDETIRDIIIAIDSDYQQLRQRLISLINKQTVAVPDLALPQINSIVVDNVYKSSHSEQDMNRIKKDASKDIQSEQSDKQRYWPPSINTKANSSP